MIIFECIKKQSLYFYLSLHSNTVTCCFKTQYQARNTCVVLVKHNFLQAQFTSSNFWVCACFEVTVQDLILLTTAI